MQTKRQIQQLLVSAGVRPNKQLGQHFLIDLNLMRLLVDSAGITADDVVLEVGCGTGSLTEGLAERAGKVVSVELDRTLAQIAKRQLAKAPNVEIINADALETKNIISPAVTEALASAQADRSGRTLLVANLPYNIASPLMLNLAADVDAMYVTVQKEVAERMTAKTGGGDYGTLSIFLAAMGDVAKIRLLKPSVFWPQPQVDSAMVAYVHDEAKSGRIRDMKIFGEIVRLFMGHRRKTLSACTRLAAGRLTAIDNWPEILDKCSVDPAKRPEQLCPEDYIAVANLCAAAKTEG
jgi:16S rRNA (adenine1518-N6/adenine1519-N6)-dimethyltransferase